MGDGEADDRWSGYFGTVRSYLNRKGQALERNERRISLRELGRPVFFSLSDYRNRYASVSFNQLV